ncbi:hypothetical protein B0H15DRAFT_956907 [Mycena belliarum]|uniref:Uncharacterized protein n=1 Tax=Mycena belliarum TaxID=1033014 RepID=A0AAD6TNF8_9AGAR|nr:hypothetical protein B0H15DRAFT_956907 [Mycena belliae]
MDRLAAVQSQADSLATKNRELRDKNKHLVTRTDDAARKLHNKARQATRARTAADGLRAELNRSKHARAVQTGRFLRRKHDGIVRAMTNAKMGKDQRWMKGKGGIFTEASREMFRELVALKVAPDNVDPIHTVGTGLGIDVQDHISGRHVGRVVEEGGITSDLQVAKEMSDSKAVALSGDGTTIKHIHPMSPQ